MSTSLLARRTVVVATGNRGKLHELRELLADLPIDLKSMAEVLPRKVEIVEDLPTFEGNARKKARLVAEACAMPVLADDSGLEVDALNGAPGVRSARYAGDPRSDAGHGARRLWQCHPEPLSRNDNTPCRHERAEARAAWGAGR